jgi:hypothetical protein
VAWEKQPQCKMSFKWTVYKFSNLLIKNACNVGLMKKNGKARLFLQEPLEWHLELHFIFFEWHLHFLLMQVPLTNPLSLRLTTEIVNLRAHHVPRWSCQQLWIQCEFTAAEVGLPLCPTDKAQKSWHWRLLGHFWGLDVLDQGQAPWPQRLSQYQLLEVLRWKEKPFFELVVPDQIFHLLAQCWFYSSLQRSCKWLSVWNPHRLHCNFNK